MGFGLVLGGGGTAGVSWTAGVVASLARAHGLDAAAAEVIIGTSAGSIIGMQLRSSVTSEWLIEQQRNPPSSPPGPRWSETIDRDALAHIFGRWIETDPMTIDAARDIAARALTASPRDPEEWLARSAAVHAAPSWGSAPLLVTGTDASTGERVWWTGDDGIPVERCVAASTAVPGIVPPIPIGERRFFDGGVWSTTNADLILSFDVERVVILASQVGAGALGDLARTTVARERALLEERGYDVTVIAPSEEYQALGPNLMDGRLRAPALEIGLADGERARL